MISREMIDRINELSKKSREAGLTEEEKQEQQELRSKYIEYIKRQVSINWIQLNSRSTSMIADTNTITAMYVNVKMTELCSYYSQNRF